MLIKLLRIKLLLVILLNTSAVIAHERVAAPAVDHHQHLLTAAMAAPGQQPIDASAMIRMLDAASIPRAVLLSNAYRYDDYAQVKAENDWTAAEAAKYPQRLVAFCGFNPLEHYALEELARCAGDPRFGRGIKLQFGASAVNLADARHVALLKKVFRAANEKGMAIVVHMRTRRSPYGAAQARVFIDELLAAAPDVPVQIAHFAGGGNPQDPAADEALEVFAAAVFRQDPRVRNLYFDLALVAPADLSPERVQFVVQQIRALGLQRILYGSDGGDPTDPPPLAQLEAFRKLPLTDTEFRQIEANVAPYLDRTESKAMRFTHIVVMAALLAPAFCDSAAPGNDRAIQELARVWLAENDGVGLSIGVYDNGQRYFYNVGTTQLDGNRLPTKDTIYDIGSIGKTMTGQLLARAVVEGRVELEDDVAKYLGAPYPNLANDGQRILLKHLPNMSTQLSDNIPDITQVRTVGNEPLAVTRMRVFSEYSKKEFLRQLQRVAPRRPPGEQPGRSNVSSMLLGVVLENVYGEPFDVILTREIEKPLRMASGTRPSAKLLAKGYTQANELLPPYGAPSQYAVDSLRYSTEDLLRYASWQLAERDASVKLAHKPTWSTPDGRLSVAYYWFVGESPRGRRLQFSGATYGFASYCDLYPEAGVAVVLLSNKESEGAQASLRALSGRIAALVRPSESISPQPSSTVAPRPDP